MLGSIYFLTLRFSTSILDFLTVKSASMVIIICNFSVLGIEFTVSLYEIILGFIVCFKKNKKKIHPIKIKW